MLQMFEEYAAGRVLTIQTGKTRKAKKAAGKKKQKKPVGAESKGDEEYKGENEAENEEEDMEINEDEEDEDEPEEYDDEKVEKQATFLSEVGNLADYPVVSNYCLILRDSDIFTDPALVPFATSYFSRIVNQLKAEWIFFQVDYLSTFHGLFQNQEFTTNARYSPLFEILKKIVNKFFELSKINHLLFVEALFRIPNWTCREQILSNYQGFLQPGGAGGSEEQKIESERIEILPPKKKIEWSEADDLLLIENYHTFKPMDNCYVLLKNMLQDPEKTIEKVSDFSLKGGSKKHKKPRLRSEWKNCR